MTKDAGMKRYIDFQQKLIDEDLINTQVSNWSDEWNRSLNDGSIASLTIGAWMPVNLMNGAPDQTGNWRVAQLPQWKEGEEVFSDDGGSALAITAQSHNQAAAYKFIEYMTLGKGAVTMSQTGNFPCLKSILDDPDFTNPESEANKKVNAFFGGQNVSAVLAEAAKRPVGSSSICHTMPSRRHSSAMTSRPLTTRRSSSRTRSAPMARAWPSTAHSRVTT